LLDHDHLDEIEMTTTLSSRAWQPAGAPTNDTSLLRAASNAADFYRIPGL